MNKKAKEMKYGPNYALLSLLWVSGKFIFGKVQRKKGGVHVGEMFPFMPKKQLV
jgi:hypothetical protein